MAKTYVTDRQDKGLDHCIAFEIFTRKADVPLAAPGGQGGKDMTCPHRLSIAQWVAYT